MIFLVILAVIIVVVFFSMMSYVYIQELGVWVYLGVWASALLVTGAIAIIAGVATGEWTV